MDSDQSRQKLERALVGTLLGTAVGDALGLPAENLPPERIQKWWPGPWRMRFFCGRGMISDDTEHAVMVAQALLSQPRDAIAFQRTLAWKLRWWFAGLPGGVGLATAKACLRMWIGFPAHRCGVASAGSGPAMRAGVIGGYFFEKQDLRREFVLRSSRLTHHSWQAELAAHAVAEAVALIVRTQGQPANEAALGMLSLLSDQAEWRGIIGHLKSSLAEGQTVSQFVRRIGLERGVTGYSLHVVPVALFAWLRHPGDFRAALENALACGGDTDTVGAIMGALAGAASGRESIPGEWIDSLRDWPRSITFMERVATRLANQQGSTRCLGPVRLFWPGVLLRNLFFLIIVLLHGFRRLAPPY